jgi:hypothetical protein
MPADKKHEKLTPKRIIADCDNWRRHLWPNWRLERRLVDYYNAGHVYNEQEDEPNDETPMSLGLGHRFIRKPFDSLQDRILSEPGFVKSEIKWPLKAERKRMVEVAFDEEVNKVVHHRLSSLISSLAGRSLITGKAFAYRMSRWDFMWKSGRLLHDAKAGADIYDESFREWAFTGTMTLRNIDERINSTRDYEGGGWSHAGLKNLKEWILKQTSTEKNTPQHNGSTVNVDDPFDESLIHTPLDVYWYFRKSGERNPFGDEKIDLYCVSRWNTSASITTNDSETATYKSLAIKTDSDEQQTIFYLENAFESIRECLVPLLLDNRIEGDQTMKAMEGLGRILISRILPTEHLAGAMLAGLSWAVQPNFQLDNSVDEELAKMIAKEGGAGPWDGLPSGMKFIDKNNALTGINGAANMLQMLGMSLDQDAATGEISPYGTKGIELKDLANRYVQQIDASVGRRVAKFDQAMDGIANQIVETMGRPITMWDKGDAAYYAVVQVHTNLLHAHGIYPVEFSSERIVGRCRRLNGDGDKAQILQSGQVLMNTYGGQFAPEFHQFLAKEAVRAMYGDPIADVAVPEKAEVDVTQQMIVIGQETMCLSSLQMPQRNASDNPSLHVASHMQTIAKRIQVAQQQGSWTPLERMGVDLLIKHTALDVPGVPPQNLQQTTQALQQMARVIVSIPVMGATSELMLKQQDAQRKMQELLLDQQHEQGLVTDRQAKLDLQHQKLMLQMRGAHTQEQNSAVQRASMLTQMAKPDETGS